MSNPENLAELESRIAFQEDAIDKLSEQVARQEMDIERLIRMVKFLNNQMKELGGADTAPEADTPPPHY